MRYIIYYETGVGSIGDAKIVDSLKELLEIKEQWTKEERNYSFKTFGNSKCHICGSNYTKYKEIEHPIESDVIHGGSNGIIWKSEEPFICDACLSKTCKHEEVYYGAGIAMEGSIFGGKSITGKTKFCARCIKNLGIVPLEEIPHEVLEDCKKGGYL